jgi:hypothetical protein
MKGPDSRDSPMALTGELFFSNESTTVHLAERALRDMKLIERVVAASAANGTDGTDGAAGHSGSDGHHGSSGAFASSGTSGGAGTPGGNGGGGEDGTQGENARDLQVVLVEFDENENSVVLSGSCTDKVQFTRRDGLLLALAKGGEK